MQLQLLSMAESIPVDLLSTILTAMSETIYRNSVQNMFKDSEQDMFKDMKKDDSVEKQFSAILEEEEDEHVIEEPIKSEEVDENSSNYEVHTTVQETTYSSEEDDKLKEFIQNELAAEESENTLNNDKSIDEQSSVDSTEAIVEYDKIKEPEVIENVPIIQEVLESYKKNAAEQEAMIQEALIEKIVQEEIVEDEETVIDEIPNEIPIEESLIEINEPNEITVELTFPNSNETNKDVMEDSMSSSYTSDLSDKVTDVVFLQPKIKDNVDFYENYELNFTKNIESANDFMKNKSINQRLFNQQKVKTLDQSWQQLCENQKKVYKNTNTHLTNFRNNAVQQQKSIFD
ncbi:unnamed protein product [Diamesa tonsa]